MLLTLRHCIAFLLFLKAGLLLYYTHSRHFNPVFLCSNAFNKEGISITQVISIISNQHICLLSALSKHSDAENVELNKMLLGKVNLINYHDMR